MQAGAALTGKGVGVSQSHLTPSLQRGSAAPTQYKYRWPPRRDMQSWEQSPETLQA